MTEPTSCGAVSVVIPCFNGEKKLPGCLAALHNQTWPGQIELIVVDDQSTDTTASLAAAAGATVLQNTGPRGPAGARNTGVAAAAHPLVAFVDDDCRPDPEWLARMVAALDTTGAVALAGLTVADTSDGRLLSRFLTAHNELLPLELASPGPRTWRRRLTGYLAGVTGLGPTPTGLRRIYSAPSCNMLIQADAFHTVGGFDADTFPFSGEDQDLWRRLGAQFPQRLWHTPDAIVRHRFGPDLADTLRRSRAYAAGNEVFRRKYPEVGQIVFPIPLAWAAATAGAAVVGRWPLPLLPTVLLPLGYARYLPLVRQRRSLEPLLYPYLHCLQETAANLEVARHEARRRFPGRRAPRT